MHSFDFRDLLFHAITMGIITTFEFNFSSCTKQYTCELNGAVKGSGMGGTREAALIEALSNLKDNAASEREIARSLINDLDSLIGYANT